MKTKEKPTNIREKSLTIPVQTILETAVEHLQQVSVEGTLRERFYLANIQQAAQHVASAEALIEIVEIHHCGSTGGFADGQTQAQRDNLIARINYLASYYGIQVLTPDEKEIIEGVRLCVDRLCKQHRSTHVQADEKVSDVLTIDQAAGLAEDIEAMLEDDEEVIVTVRDVIEYWNELKDKTIAEMAIDLVGYLAKDRFTSDEEIDEDDTDEDEDY